MIRYIFELYTQTLPDELQDTRGYTIVIRIHSFDGEIIDKLYKVGVVLPNVDGIQDIIDTINHEDLHVALDMADSPMEFEHDCIEKIEELLQIEMNGAIEAMISNVGGGIR